MEKFCLGHSHGSASVRELCTKLHPSTHKQAGPETETD